MYTGNPQTDSLANSGDPDERLYDTAQMRSFAKITPSRNDEITDLLMVVNRALVADFNVTNMSFNAIRENKILAKIPEFRVKMTLQGNLEILTSLLFDIVSKQMEGPISIQWVNSMLQWI